MRPHSSDRKMYAALKKDLADCYPDDIFNYVFGKDAFVAAVDAKTGFCGTRITKALTPREWEKSRALRQKFFLIEEDLLEDPS